MLLPPAASGDSLRCPAAARAETGGPERKDRERVWFTGAPPAAGVDEVAVGVEDLGGARDGEDEGAIGSRPGTGGFFAVAADIDDLFVFV